MLLVFFCYPLQYYEPLEDIYIVTMQGRKLMINNRAQWDIPQIFDWERIDPKMTNEFPPSESQLKQMVHQFIAGGATGLIFFDYSDMKAMDYKNPFALLNLSFQLAYIFRNFFVTLFLESP